MATIRVLADVKLSDSKMTFVFDRIVTVKEACNIRRCVIEQIADQTTFLELIFGRWYVIEQDGDYMVKYGDSIKSVSADDLLYIKTKSIHHLENEIKDLREQIDAIKEFRLKY